MWVSRGGYKLDKAINEFEVDCTDIIAMDMVQVREVLQMC